MTSPKTPFVEITLKPDEDLMQELHREAISYDDLDKETQEKIDKAIKDCRRPVGNYQSTIKPEPMKKHELLKYAYDNYPKGTIARFRGKAPDHTSTGKFEITDLNSEGDIQVMSENGLECFYCYGEWAVPVPASILTGRCAVQVNNEREFKLLMEHYQSKGWKWEGGDSTSILPKKPSIPMEVSYKDGCSCSYIGDCENSIPFADFAKAVGIKMPVFVLRSEDEVDLYEGEIVHHVCIDSLNKKWKYNTTAPLSRFKPVNPFFSTKEVDEAWVLEQNKPAVIRLEFEGGEAIITKDKIRVHLDAHGGKGYYMEASEIEPIYTAYKSLQS